MTGKILLSIVLTFVIIVVVPFPAYGLFSAAGLVEPPDESAAASFMIGILVSKVGTAMAFVLIFHVGSGVFSDRWLLYASLWLLMSVIHEIGQAIGPGYSPMDALAGIISETVYFPLAAYVIWRLLRPPVATIPPGCADLEP
ncbi:MAG: hypothetical protein PVI86_03355 [Phycisphaerae bacterium]